MGFVDKNGKYQGSVVMGFNIENIYQRFVSGKVLSNSNLQIIYKNEIGLIKDSFNLDKKYSARIDFENPNIQTLEQSAIFHLPPTLIYQKIPNTPYGFLINYDNFDQFKIIKKSYLLEFFSVLSFLAILIYLLKKEFINPIIFLSNEAELVGLGKAEIRTPESNILEINQLSKAVLSLKKFIRNEQLLKHQLYSSNQKLQDLTKSISHDLRNYISGVSGLANIIAADKKPTPENIHQDQQYAKMITNQSGRMMEFAKEILDTKNAELGIIKLGEIKDCNIEEIIQEMLVLNQQFVKDQLVKIITDFPTDLPVVKCHERRLHQVLDNLITNAVKYSKKDGKVKISAEKLQNKICISIQDNGIGMSAKDIQMALSGDGKDIDKSDLDKQFDSHGIGMLIVKQITEEIGAQMEIESVKGKGTTVKLWINCEEENHKINQIVKLTKEEAATTSLKIEQKKNIKNNSTKTIIIAEDEDINLLLLQRMLEVAGYKVLKAQNGSKVLDILDKEECDLIFMDINMPELNGLKATKIIRSGVVFENQKYQTIPIIGIGGDFDENALTTDACFLIHADEMEAYIEQVMDQMEESMLNPKIISGSYELQINIEGSEVFFYIMLNERFAKPGKLNSIKSDLIYQLSSLIEKASSKLAISEMATEFPTLCLRMKKPSKKSDFDAISASISNFCEEL